MKRVVIWRGFTLHPVALVFMAWMAVCVALAFIGWMEAAIIMVGAMLACLILWA